MELRKAKKRAEELGNIIRRHDYLYYVAAQPEISDYEYDQLIKELEEIEGEHPALITPESPTQRVGKDITREFTASKHLFPMLSLANTYSENELFDFDRRVREGLEKNQMPQYVVEYKIDGVSINLLYENGKLIKAATRGDGEAGEEVTNNVKTLRSIPLILPENLAAKYSLRRFEVRGEIYMEKSDFEKLNEERARQGEKLFANPRNFSAGTVKLQDPKIVAQRPLKIFTYYLLAESGGGESHWENLSILKELGFRVNPNTRRCATMEEVLAVCGELEEQRDSLAYEIDGAVVKVDSIQQQKKLGSVAKSPRWAVAFKFKAKQAATLLHSITWQVGRTGAVTPVAELEPVLLAGSMISRATLHNFDEIARKDIRIGDTVIVEKGGDVIPKIARIVEDKRKAGSKPVSAPDACPACGGNVYRGEDEAALYCQNAECPEQIKGRIEHFASRGAMDIEGLGEAIVEQFVEKGFIHTYADLYDLAEHREELSALERFGKKSIDNLLNAIEKSKQQPFPKVLYALGIRFVGAGVARKLASHFLTVEKLIAASEEEIASVYEIGASISRSTKQFFSDPHNVSLISRLKEKGVCFETEAQNVGENFFTNKTFVLTGTMETMTREEGQSRIIALGGKVSASVSKKTHIVIAGPNAGSKLTKANELGIQIMDEKAFLLELEKAR